VLVDHALKGINSCCFAYGQTGSGKTFRYNALPHSEPLAHAMTRCIPSSIFGEAGEKAGVMPRTVAYLFDSVKRNESKGKVWGFFYNFHLYLVDHASLKRIGRHARREFLGDLLRPRA
jgi:Kinesin motor domain